MNLNNTLPVLLFFRICYGHKIGNATHKAQRKFTIFMSPLAKIMVSQCAKIM